MRVSIENTNWGFHIRLRSEDREEFDHALERFKASIPKSLRRFRADQGFWYVERRCANRINLWLSLLRDELEELEVELDGQTQEAEPEQEDALQKALEILCLTDKAPLFIVRAVRKAYARQYHPDRGQGNEEMMKQFNHAADVIEHQISQRSCAA